MWMAGSEPGHDAIILWLTPSPGPYFQRIWLREAP